MGHKQYFVSSDVGGGKMQWYAFYNEAPGGVDDANGKYTSHDFPVASSFNCALHICSYSVEKDFIESLRLI